MQDITTTVNVILAFFGGLVCISGGVSVIIKLLSPFRKLKTQVEEHEEKLQSDYQKFEAMEEAIKSIEDSNKVICKSLLVLMNHEITGNSIDKLKAQKEAMEQYLIDK